MSEMQLIVDLLAYHHRIKAEAREAQSAPTLRLVPGAADAGKRKAKSPRQRNSAARTVRKG